MHRPLRIALFALAAAAPAPSLAQPSPAAAVESPEMSLADATRGLKGKGPLTAKVDVQTDGVKGTFTCTLFDEKAPKTVANFVALARGLRAWRDPKTEKWVKRPLYDGTLFHRVIPNFMIQGGDPEGSGRGGPGYEFDDEISPEVTFDRAGLLAMANKGKNRATGRGTNGSQFFITEQPTPWLNGKHTIFGECTPLDLESKLARVPAAQANKPTTDVVIKKVTITRGAAEKAKKGS
jgi:peptidyl-prolyl cis-trans isomerase A (cyclophilin A)